VARSTNQVDIEFLPKGLHDIGQEKMSARLHEVLGQGDDQPYEAVLLGYGLCSNGLVGLAAGNVPLVVPRAHDCITLFLGNKQRYVEYFHSHPGAYFKTSGWIERAQDIVQYGPDSIQKRDGLVQSYDELVAKYGEDNARYLWEQLCDLTRNYSRLTYIEMGIEPDGRFEEETRRQAAQRGWEFEKLQGDLSLIQALVDGPWEDERFLVVPPGHRVAASFDGEIIRAENTRLKTEN
jgi:hypothetical protein